VTAVSAKRDLNDSVILPFSSNGYPQEATGHSLPSNIFRLT